MFHVDTLAEFGAKLREMETASLNLATAGEAAGALPGVAVAPVPLDYTPELPEREGKGCIEQ